MASSDDLYYSSITTLHRFDTNTALATTSSGVTHVLDMFAWRVAASLSGVKPLVAHGQRASEQLDSVDVATLADIIVAFVEMGVLVPYRPLPQTILTKQSAIDCVAIVTRDRPPLLERCLGYLAAQCALFGRTPRVLVIDGSSSPAIAAANRAHSVRAAADLPRLVYIGTAEATTITTTLCRGDHLSGVATFALTLGDIGSGRNLAMLLAGDRPVLMVDDDVILDPWQFAASSSDIIVTGHYDSRDWHLFMDRRQCLTSLERTPVDVLLSHGQSLGLKLSHATSRASHDIDLDHACSHISRLLESGGGVVRTAQTGLAGDNARYCPQTMLFGDGNLKRQLFGDAAQCELAMRYREVAVAATSLTIAHDIGTATYCTSFDMTGSLPPFMPTGRNEDGVFGAILGTVDTAALSAHLPFGVVHDSLRGASTAAEQNLWSRHARLSDYVIAALKAVSQYGGAPPSLQRLGTALYDFASLGQREFQSIVTAGVVSLRSSLLAPLQDYSRSPFCPQHIHREVSALVTEFKTSLASGTFLVPVDVVGRCEAGNEFRWLRDFIRNFGETLTVWNDWRTFAGTIELPSVSGDVNV